MIRSQGSPPRFLNAIGAGGDKKKRSGGLAHSSLCEGWGKANPTLSASIKFGLLRLVNISPPLFQRGILNKGKTGAPFGRGYQGHILWEWMSNNNDRYPGEDIRVPRNKNM